MARAHTESENPFGGPPLETGDFFAPFYKVEFITARTILGKRVVNNEEVVTGGSIFGAITAAINTALNSQINVSLSDESEMLRAFATSLTIRVPGEGVSTCTLVLEPPYEDAMRIVDDATIQYDSVMKIEWGWLPAAEGQEGKSSGPHYYVLQPPAMTIDRGDVQITLTGVEILAHNYATREGRRTWSREQYPDDLLIIRALLEPLGITPDVTLVPDQVERNGETVSHPLIARKGTTETKPVEGTEGRQLVRMVVGEVEQNERTWTFFNRLIRSNNCDYFMSGNKCYIVDRNAAKIQKPSYRLVHYQQITSALDIPMFTWATNVNPDLFIVPAEARGIRYASFDPDSGDTRLATFDPAASSLEEFIGERTRSGRGGPDGITLRIGDIQLTPNLAMADDEQGRHSSQPDALVNGDERARQGARRASVVANTEASTTIPGMPRLFPWMVVRVEGVGTVFSGNYLISEVTHNLVPGDGFSTDLKLIRDTSTGDSQDGRGQRPQTSRPQQEVERATGVGRTGRNGT